MKDLSTMISDYNSQNVEDCMIPKKPYDGDKLPKNIFRTSPLLGDYILSQATYDRLYEYAKKMVDNCVRHMQDREPLPNYLIDAHEVLTLVVIELAKRWNRDVESSFSKYVALSFGYNGDNLNRVWNIVKNSLDIAINRNKKLFIIKNGDRRFHETIMVHSFGPANTWYPLFDLLFSFYKINLLFYYDSNDPLFSTLVNALSRKFDDVADEEKELLIASQYYRLRVGIRRIVQYCPNYCTVLFKDIVHRMHCLINGNRDSSDRYVINLVDKWFLNKIREDSIGLDGSHTNDEVVFDHRKIVVRYYQSAGNLYLNVPTIRINNTDALDAYANVYIDGKPFKTTLNVYGNELGRTIKRTLINIDTNMLSGDSIDVRIQLFYGQQVIFDSENKLIRQLLFFSEGTELSANNLGKGSYTMICPQAVKLDGTNYDVSEPRTIVSTIILHKGYDIRCNGHTIALDSSDVHEIRLVEPECAKGIQYNLQGKSYKIISRDKMLMIYFPNRDELCKYHVYINDEKSNLQNYIDDNTGNRAVITFDLPDTTEYEITIARADNDAVVYFDCFLISNIRYSFNRSYYTNASEDIDSVLSLTIEDQNYELPFKPEQTKVNLKYGEGELSVRVPFLNYAFTETYVLRGNYIWINDITKKSSICITNNSSKSYSVIIGKDEYCSQEIISLFKYKEFEHRDKTTKVYLRCDSDTYCIGEIVYSPFFSEMPVIKYSDNVLTCIWEHFYVGGKDDLELSIKSSNSELLFDLMKDGKSFSEFYLDSFEEGKFDVEITSSSFEDPVAVYTVFIGAEKYSRFYNRVLCLRYITDDNSDIAESVEIKPIYVEKIAFVCSEYVASEDGIYDIYSGEMYWKNSSGAKIYYSYEYNDEKHTYKVNPVKIIYLNERYLRIVNQDDEGLYFYSYKVNDDVFNQISDREPSKGNTSFSDVLFFVNESESNEDKRSSSEKQAAVNHNNPNCEKDASVSNPINIDGITKKLRIKSFQPMFANWKKVEQTRIIDADVGERIIVNAGPGTGKTWSLIEKIIHLVNIEDVDPETIQVLCFSRAAVEEVKARMMQAIVSGRADLKTNYVDIRTFDSFATQLLYWIKDSDYGILKKTFQIEALNYDERIELLTSILQQEPDLISQCSHLIVDEVQDLVLSRADLVLQMIRCIPSESGVTLLGDCCQAIYGYQVDGEGTNTEDFYQRIYDDKDFQRFEFSKNYRQTEWWDDACHKYRTSIMSSIISDCNKTLKAIKDQIPEFDVYDLSKFDEDSFNRIREKGKVAILTRSNAQALTIADAFKKKNIDFSLRRKRHEIRLNKWIAYVFNSEKRHAFDGDHLLYEINRYLADNPINQDDFDDIWKTLIGMRKRATGSIDSGFILTALCNRITNKRIYIDEKDSNTIISTIHRSKGREYGNVLVDVDLVNQNKDELEEHRVAYVALSRAKNNVYAVKMPEVYFKTLDNRRCYSWEQRNKYKYLKKIEIGFDRDFDEYSFCSSKGCQEFIRTYDKKLIGRKAYLEKRPDFAQNRGYNLFVEGTNRVIATTGDDFLYDLEDAIRQLKNLSQNTTVYDSLFPKRFVDLYVSDISTSIGMVRGNELGVIEYNGNVCWNTLLIEGYARAEYI